MVSVNFHDRLPFRSPEWRSERAMRLNDRRPRPLRPRRFDDRYIRAYWRFLQNYVEAGANDDANCALFVSSPAIYHAHVIHFHPDTEWRTILQARLLSRESYAVIGRNMGISEEAVDWYEKLFFNIRDRMDAKDWIIKVVIGSPADRASNKADTLTEAQRELLYKLFAYHGGPLVLDAVLSGFVGINFPKHEKDVAGWMDGTLSNMIRTRAMMAAKTFEVNKFNVMQLMELQLNLMNLEKSDGTGGAKNDVEKNVELFVQRMSWGLSPRVLEESGELTQRYMTSAAEPTALEQLALADGREPEALALAQSTVDYDRLAAPPEREQTTELQEVTE